MNACHLRFVFLVVSYLYLVMKVNEGSETVPVNFEQNLSSHLTFADNLHMTICNETFPPEMANRAKRNIENQYIF